MKKLEELGISRVPWRLFLGMPFGNERFTRLIQAAPGAPCYTIGEVYEVPDAQMASAAPKLYKALYELVEAYEACNAHDGTCENCERRKMCQQDEERIIANAKSALAEAAGEGGEAAHDS